MDLRIAGLLALIAAGCSGPGSECNLDRECGGGDVCANTHDCVPAGTVHRVVVRWIIPSCPGDLEISVFDDESSDFAHYAPVRCDLGQFTFDKLPDHFDRVRVLILDDGRSGEARIPPDGGDVVVEL